MELRPAEKVGGGGGKELSNRTIFEDDLAARGHIARPVGQRMHGKEARVAFDHDGARLLEAWRDERDAQRMIGVAYLKPDPFRPGPGFSRAAAA
jgi:hypothetical protein